MYYLILIIILLLLGYLYEKYSNEHYQNEYYNNKYIFEKQLPNPFYEQKNYPNMKLQPQVIGCGARNTPCLGGTQVPIANPMPPIDISNDNIAPITININKPNKIIQIGVLYKIFGNFNTYIPIYYNPIDQSYFGIKNNQKIIIHKHNLGINDEITINNEKYRITIYDDSIPQYVA